MPDQVSGSRSRESAIERYKFLWEVAKGAAMLGAAVFSYLANQSATTATLETERLRTAVEERGQQSQFDIKAYERVEKALSSALAEREGYATAAAAIVNALTKSPLRDELQNALRAGSTDAEVLKKLDDARRFDLESSEISHEVPPPDQSSRNEPSWLSDALAPVRRTLVTPVSAQAASTALRGYRVDVFYCEAASQPVTAARKARADAAAAKLKTSGVATVRTRLLPSLVQARPGYQSFADQVRFSEGARERQAATELAVIRAGRESASPSSCDQYV